MILGNIASVATLILFVFYFIGRIITIVRNRYVFTDELRMMGAGFDNKEFDIVEVFDLEKEAYNTFILTSRQGIYDLAVYRILYDSDFNQIGRKRLEKSTTIYLFIKNLRKPLSILSKIRKIALRCLTVLADSS